MAPARRKTLEGTRRVTQSMPAVEGRKVLVADDDQAVRERIRSGLEGQPFAVLEARDGAAALSAVRRHHPDLLLMDVEMPGLSGVEVCRIVKANQGPSGFGFTPVILMTARSGGKVEGLELGADDYLIKPFDMLELSARVRAMLRLKGLQDALVAKNQELDKANRVLEAQRQQLEELSRTDGLTGLVNRRHFDERLADEFARASRFGSPLSCLLLDVDHFKKVNDTYGHPFGDEVLKAVARVSRKALRDVDLLARYGGEEMVALLPETGPAEALKAAERVRRGVESLALDHQGTTVRCTTSVGVATLLPGTYPRPEALLEAADGCLYRAKQGGRNRVVQANP